MYSPLVSCQSPLLCHMAVDDILTAVVPPFFFYCSHLLQHMRWQGRPIYPPLQHLLTLKKNIFQENRCIIALYLTQAFSRPSRLPQPPLGIFFSILFSLINCDAGARICVSFGAHKTVLETAVVVYESPSKCAPFLLHMVECSFRLLFSETSGKN